MKCVYIQIKKMKAFKLETSNLTLRAAVVRPALLSAFLLLIAHCSLLTAQAAWSKQKTGTFAWLHAVYFLDERRGWAVGGKGALLSTADGGMTWEVRRRPTEDALEDIFFTDEMTGWIVCERSMFMPMAKDESVSYLLKTRDGGGSWTRVEVTRGADVDLKLGRVRFADRERGWVFGEMGALFATTDGGGSWTRQSVPTRHRLLGASFLDASRGWLVGAGSTLLETTDGGATWREGRVELAAVSLPPNMSPPPRAPTAQTPGSSMRLNAVSFADTRRGWAVGAGGAVLATTDGGRTWRAQQSGTESDLFDVKFFDEREGWAVGGDGTAIHTADGGATWSAEPTGTPHTLECLFFKGRTRGWAVGFGGTVVTFKG
ncbi:MAG: hypothetical protein QOC99_3041 [Acidobacteriota bacterium]|jgi:photosystem II stability/assembly factor-like uncharacterized protein|nr:hypothetical protein [Acidobacteriota bacterium]